MFEFLFVIGLILAFYGYSVMKNPNVWGDQGRDEVKTENWKAYVVRNGQFFMYSGFFLAGLAALDVIFTFSDWVFTLVLLGGLALLLYPLAHWMHEQEGTWNPWTKREAKRKKQAKLDAKTEQGGKKQ